VNGSPKGLGIAAAATSTGVIALAASGAATVSELTEAIGAAADSANATFQELLFQTSNNPTWISNAADFVSQFAGLPGFPETVGGVAGAASQEITKHWGQVTGWLRSEF
jgi:hypothetical protein